MTSPTAPPPEHLERLGRQFLVHAFLYYRLGENLIEDSEFDRIAEELRRLHLNNPALGLPFAEVLEPALGAEASGFQIRKYPPTIISIAFKLLYEQSAQARTMDFTEFVERRGYRVQRQETDGITENSGEPEK